jgi:hypothetical protein
MITFLFILITNRKGKKKILQNVFQQLTPFFSSFFLQLDDLKAGSSTSPNLEGTSVAPAGHRDGKEKLSQLIQVLRIDKQFDN